MSQRKNKKKKKGALTEKLQESTRNFTQNIPAHMGTEISLKLLINRSTNQVLFAEAGKDFVDFLFSLLAMPVGSIVQLLSNKRMVGSLWKVYSSLKSLSDNYMQPNFDKNLALNPTITTPVVTQTTLLLQNNASPLASQSASPSATAKCYYHCGSQYVDCFSGNFTDVSGTSCPNCGYEMSTQMNYVSPTSVKEQTGASGGVEGGYVKGVVTYTVMDDLAVTPMSTISHITLLNKFQIKEVGKLEEKVVHVRIEEGLNLLKASLESSTVLTDVFLLGKK